MAILKKNWPLIRAQVRCRRRTSWPIAPSHLGIGHLELSTHLKRIFTKLTIITQLTERISLYNNYNDGKCVFLRVFFVGFEKAWSIFAFALVFHFVLVIAKTVNEALPASDTNFTALCCTFRIDVARNNFIEFLAFILQRRKQTSRSFLNLS